MHAVSVSPAVSLVQRVAWKGLVEIPWVSRVGMAATAPSATAGCVATLKCHGGWMRGRVMIPGIEVVA